MRPWHAFSASISRTLIGLIPTKITSISGGLPHSLLSQTGPPRNTTPRRCTCKYMFLSIFLTLKITMLFYLVLLNVCRYLLSPHYFHSLRVSAVLDHFGYPAPHLDQWQQRFWYDLGATQEALHQMRTRLS